MKNNASVSPLYKLEKNYSNNLYVKREDLLPFSFGGNKARKAELFFEDILSKGCNHIVTYGSSSSNHCRVVANKACSLGLKCTVISPIEDSHTTNNTKLVKLFGAKIIYSPLDQIKTTIDATMNELDADGEKPYFIQGGGHGNIGTQAFVNCYAEILDFEKHNGILFDYIFLASGTGTTQAGLIAGAYLAKSQTKIIGISIARKKDYGFGIIKDSVMDYLQSKNINTDELSFSNYDFDDSYICSGYGKYNNEILETVKEIMCNEGIPLNTTYSGKAFWGMQKYLEQNKIVNKNVLFINTGGAPLFFETIEELGDK